MGSRSKPITALDTLFRAPQIPLALFLFTFVLYTYHSRYVGSGDTVPAELLPISILTERNLDFDEFLCNPAFKPEVEHRDSFKVYYYFDQLCGKVLPYWFYKAQGRIVSLYPVVPGLLNTPVYLLFALAGKALPEGIGIASLITAALTSSLSVAFMFLCLKRTCQREATPLLFALSYGFGTLTWSVASKGLWQHGPSLMFLTAAFALLYDDDRDTTPLAGLLLAFAVCNRPTNVFIAIPVSFYVFFSRRSLFIRYCFWAAGPAVLLSAYSHSYLGNILALGQGQGLSGFRGNPLVSFVGLLLSPARGLLVFSPMFLFGLLYLPRTLSKRRYHPLDSYLAFSCLLLLTVYSFWGNWWGGYSFGYRLVIELIPAFIVFTARYWEEHVVHAPALRALFFILLVISILVQFLGAEIYPCGFNDTPNDVNLHTSRLWQVTGTEILRCAARLQADFVFPILYFSKRLLVLAFFTFGIWLMSRRPSETR